MPLPDNETDCELALSMMVRVPDSTPRTLGVNESTMVQCPPGNNGLEVEQVLLLDMPKSLRLVVMIENVTLVA